MKYLLFILFFVIQLSAISQSADDIVQYDKLNIKFVEYLVKEKVNQFRQEKNIAPLRLDSMLYLPAEDHTYFMQQRNRLTHFQARGAKHDPQRRFEYFEINHVMAGENIQYIPINSLIKVDYQKDLVNIRTYNDLAEVLAKNWRYSKPHYANIITKEFSVTAVSIKVDLDKELIWATQVFGEVIGDHPLTRSNAFFPHDTLELISKKKNKKAKPLEEQQKFNYGLKKPQSFADCPRELNNKLDLSNLKLQVTRDKVLLCVYDLNKIKRLFPDSKDGLVVELISFGNTFSCDALPEKPNRRNDLSLIDGQLLKPVYQKSILKQIEQLEEENRKRKKVRGEKRCNFIILGDTPPELSGKPIDARLYYVNNKNLCTQIDFFGYCGEPLNYKPSSFPLKFDLPKDTFKPASDTFSIPINIQFEKSSSTIQSSEIDTLIEQLKAQELIIKRIDIQAFSSVEGSEEQNTKLFDARTKRLVERLGEFQQQEIEWQVNAQENWDLFYDQIIGTDWFYLNSYNRSKIRSIINDSANTVKLEPLLAEQRKAKISVVVIPKMSDKWIFKLAKSEWETVLNGFDARTASLQQVDRLEALQVFFYNNYQKCNEKQQQWIASQYVGSSSDKTALLEYRQLMFSATNFGVSMPLETVEKLKKLNTNLGSLELDYNIKSIIASNADLFDEKTKIPLIKSLMNQAKIDEVPSKVYQELELWYHVEIANLVFGSQDKKGLDKAEPSLQYVREFYINENSTTEDTIRLAKFMVLFDKLDWVTELLKPIAFDTLRNPYKKQALKLYLQTCIAHDLSGRDTEMQLVVTNAFETLGEKQWCRLFFTPCAIPYKVFDYDPLRYLYCEACKEYTTSPVD